MMDRIFAGCARRVRSARLRMRGVSISGRIWLSSIEIPRNHTDIHLEDGVSLDNGVTLISTGTERRTRISIGANTYVNRYTIIDASENISIGDHCMIGPLCYITDHDHGLDLCTPIQSQLLVSDPVTIEDGAWIGAHATILKGVHIAKGAVVGAGSVVTKNVAENEIVVGVPAKRSGIRSDGRSREHRT